uniref:Interphotoreceptor matrix proteoglycan 2-like isoform X2 n=1 Tax=Geotrypetes seraphini TaxID=260995 RepID=A0A6P8NMN9_GEOSA|nr:interphotoreceptor matrix proteoglycan 2-like isoform X2 [Geotrypetes seraphini]
MNQVICLLLAAGGFLGLVISDLMGPPPVESRYEQAQNKPILGFIVEEKKPNFQHSAYEPHTACMTWTNISLNRSCWFLQRNKGAPNQTQQQNTANETQHRSWLELVKAGSAVNSTRERIKRPNHNIDWPMPSENNPSLMQVTQPWESLVTETLPARLGNDERRKPTVSKLDRYRNYSKANQLYLKKINSLTSHHMTSQELKNSTRDFTEGKTFSTMPDLSTQHTETQPSINSFTSHLLQETFHKSIPLDVTVAPLGNETILTPEHKQQRKIFSPRNPELQSTNPNITSIEEAGLSKPVDSINTLSELLDTLNISKTFINSVRLTSIWKMLSPENASSLEIPEAVLQGLPKERENKLDIGLEEESNEEHSISSLDLHSNSSGVSLSHIKQPVTTRSVLYSLLKRTTDRDSATRVLKVSEFPASATTATDFQRVTNLSLFVGNNSSDSALFSEVSFETKYNKLSSAELNASASQGWTELSTLANRLLSELTRSPSAPDGPTSSGDPWSEGTMSVSHSPPQLGPSASPSTLTTHSTLSSSPMTGLYNMISLKTLENIQDVSSQWPTMLMILQINTKWKESKTSTKIVEDSSATKSNGIFLSPSVESLEMLQSTANGSITMAAENQTEKDFMSSSGTPMYFVGFERPTLEINVDSHITKLIPTIEIESYTEFPYITSAEKLVENQRHFIMEDQPPLLKGNVMPVTCRLILEKSFCLSFENPDSPKYKKLALSFQETVVPFYKLVPGFKRLDLLKIRWGVTSAQIRKGTVVFEYNALFSVDFFWLMLKDFQSMLDMTGLPKLIKSGLTIANSTVLSLSVAEKQADPCREFLQCPGGFDCIYGRNGSARCTSLCHRGFCKNNGSCTHQSNQEPRCKCPVGHDYWFMGASCDHRMSQQKLVGLACAVVLGVLLTLVLSTYLLIRRFKVLLREAKLSPTKSSYRRFSLFDDISTKYWSNSWLPSSANSLDNPAYYGSEDLLHLHMLESNRCSCQEVAPGTQGETQFQAGTKQSFLYDWAMSSSGITTHPMDSGKVSEMSLYSKPVQPMEWIPQPNDKQTAIQQTLRDVRRSYCEGTEVGSMQRSWTV